jgi:hypothetical protein
MCTAGQKLQHGFVALQTINAVLSLDSKTNKFTATVEMPGKSLPRSPRQAIAAWVTRNGDITALQATGGWLN